MLDSNDTHTRLSDIDLNVDGYTQQDVIDNREAKLDMVRDGALRGNKFCLETMWLDAQAKSMGLDVSLNEELDDDDFY